MSYMRVLPRDLFNESKLLKCLGRVSLLLHDGVSVPKGLELEQVTDDGFHIDQRLDDGGLYCRNLGCYLNVGEHRFGIDLYTTYNSKAEYPLCYETDNQEFCGTVFTASGEFTLEFFEACRLIGKGTV